MWGMEENPSGRDRAPLPNGTKRTLVENPIAPPVGIDGGDGGLNDLGVSMSLLGSLTSCAASPQRALLLQQVLQVKRKRLLTAIRRATRAEVGSLSWQAHTEAEEA